MTSSNTIGMSHTSSKGAQMEFSEDAFLKTR